MKKEFYSNTASGLLLWGGAGLLLTATAHAQQVDDSNSPPMPRPMDRDRLAKWIIDEINIARKHAKEVSDSIEQQRSAYITQRTKQIVKPDSEKVAAEAIDTCLDDLRIYVGINTLSELKVAPKGMLFAQKCCDTMPDDKKIIWYDMVKGWEAENSRRRSMDEIRANGTPWREIIVPIPTYVPKPQRGWADEVDIARRLVLDNLIDWDHDKAFIPEMRYFHRQVLLDFRCKLSEKLQKEMKKQFRYIGVGVGKKVVRIQLGA
jgi:hypothetical protein